MPRSSRVPKFLSPTKADQTAAIGLERAHLPSGVAANSVLRTQPPDLRDHGGRVRSLAESELGVASRDPGVGTYRAQCTVGLDRVRHLRHSIPRHRTDSVFADVAPFRADTDHVDNAKPRGSGRRRPRSRKDRRTQSAVPLPGHRPRADDRAAPPRALPLVHRHHDHRGRVGRRLAGASQIPGPRAYWV